MKNYRKLILTGTGLLFVTAAMAQEQPKDSTLNRTVVVENQYNPEVMDAFKVNVLPKVEEPAVAKQHIDYATSIYPLTSYAFEPMGVITRDVSQKGTHRGYLRGAYGTLNNVDVKGAYLWNMTERDQLDVMGSFYGHSGDVNFPDTDIDNKQRFYRADVSIDYRHDFRKVKMNLGGSFGSQVFNHFSTAKINEDQIGSEIPEINLNQHFMLGEGHLGFASVQHELPLDFAFQVGFGGFKRMHPIGSMVGESLEKQAHTQGFVSGKLDDEQKVGVGFAMDNMFYSGGEQDDMDLDPELAEYRAMDNYTLVKLNPYYTLQREDLYIRLGAHVDFQTANGSGLKVAPDVNLTYTFADSYSLYAQALGGTRLNGYRQLNEVSPYWNQQHQLQTTYTVFDAQAGFKASPVTGLGLHLYGGYKMTKDDVFVNMLSSYDNHTYVSPLVQDKSKVAYFGAGIDYAYRDWFDLGVKGQYNNWKIDSEENIKYLILKPEYTLNVSARAKVYKGMHALLDYTYENRNEVSGERLDAVNNLKLGAEYNYIDRASVFVHLNNLLNQSYFSETGYPELGFNIMAGISVNF